MEADLLAVFDKWDLECEHIGEVTDTGRLEFYAGGELVADVPSEPLVLGGGAPVYERETQRPTYLDQVEAFQLEDVKAPEDLAATSRELFLSPNLVSKHWVTDQYDGTVRTNSMSENDRSDAALVRVKGTGQGTGGYYGLQLRVRLRRPIQRRDDCRSRGGAQHRL